MAATEAAAPDDDGASRYHSMMEDDFDYDPHEDDDDDDEDDFHLPDAAGVDTPSPFHNSTRDARRSRLSDSEELRWACHGADVAGLGEETQNVSEHSEYVERTTSQFLLSFSRKGVSAEQVRSLVDALNASTAGAAVLCGFPG